MNNRIYECIIAGIKDFNETFDDKIDLSKGSQTELFSGNGVLDSLGLVNLILSIEDKLSEEFDISISLASEKAMSQKISPFKSIESLHNYIQELLAETK